MPKSLTHRVDDLVARAEPLDVLEFLVSIRNQTPALRAEALGSLLAAGWTRYAIAQEIGITAQAVGQWEATPVPKRSRS